MKYIDIMSFDEHIARIYEDGRYKGPPDLKHQLETAIDPFSGRDVTNYQELFDYLKSSFNNGFIHTREGEDSGQDIYSDTN